MATPQANPAKPVRKAPVTLPTFSFKDRDYAWFKCVDRIKQGRQISAKGAVEKDKKPADIMTVIDLTNGQMCEMLVPTVLKSNLEEKVKDYVNKCYEVRVTQREGKSYKDFEVWETEDPTKVTPATPAEVAAGKR